MSLTLEIVEGPGASRQFAVSGPLVIGRDPSADVVLNDTQASRHHARLTPSAQGAVVEDLESTNGTFVNDNEVHGPAEVGPNDELMVGVTVMQLRTQQDVARQASAVRPVPPALAVPESRPSFVDPVVEGAATPGRDVPELERLRDATVRAKARLAPLAIFVVVALVVVIYFGATTA